MASSSLVHLIDDDEGVRQSLAFSLATAGFAVKVFESGTAFLDALEDLPPGCIVTDVRMPGVDGLELQRRLNALKINLPVIIMTGHGDVALAVEAMKAGALDFIEKPFDDEVLITAIRLALDRYDRAEHEKQELREIQEKLNALTPRERQVLDGLLAGLPNKTIAYDLNLSPRTVEVHRANVMMKMGATSLSNLVRMAILANALPGT